jgi:hypothetical protein
MAVFSPAFRNSKLSELLEQCVRIPNSSASIRFLAVLIEDAGEALTREDLLWRGRRGGLKTARAAYAGGVVFVDRRPGIFIPTEVTVTPFFSNNNRETRVAAGTGCSVRKPAFDPISSLK